MKVTERDEHHHSPSGWTARIPDDLDEVDPTTSASFGLAGLSIHGGTLAQNFPYDTERRVHVSQIIELQSKVEQLRAELRAIKLALEIEQSDRKAYHEIAADIYDSAKRVADRVKQRDEETEAREAQLRRTCDQLALQLHNCRAELEQAKLSVAREVYVRFTINDSVTCPLIQKKLVQTLQKEKVGVHCPRSEYDHSYSTPPPSTRLKRSRASSAAGSRTS